MHAEISDFIERMKSQFPDAFKAKRVLECGSFDINGNPRRFFNADEYVGIDWRRGPGVDEISMVHEYKNRPDNYFGFVISTSLLEHDPHWCRSIQRMVELVAMAGSLLITCAGPGFHQHELETSPPDGKFYDNKMMHEVVEEIMKWSRFERIILEEDINVKDIRIMCMNRLEHKAGVPAGIDLRSGLAI